MKRLLLSLVALISLSSFAQEKDIKEIFFNQENHISFQGINFLTLYDDFKNAIKEKGWKENYMSSSVGPEHEIYDGYFNGKQAQLILSCQKGKIYYGAMVTFNMNTRKEAIEYRDELVKKLEAKYNSKSTKTLNVENQEDFVILLDGAEYSPIGHIHVCISDRTFDGTRLFGTSLSYYDALNAAVFAKQPDDDL